MYICIFVYSPSSRRILRNSCKTFPKLFAFHTIVQMFCSLETVINIAEFNFACLFAIIPNIQHFYLFSCRQGFNFGKSSERPVDVTCYVGFMECVPPETVITINNKHILIESADDYYLIFSLQSL